MNELSLTTRLRCRLVTNLPTPYRNHTYALWAEAFARRGVDFDVAFLTWTEPGRHWRFTPADLHYPHKMYGGVHLVVRGVVMHFNAGLLVDLWRDAPDILIVAGWASPSHVLSPFLASTRSTRICWSETNPESEQHTTKSAHWLKRRLIGPYDGFIVPGHRSRKYLEALDPTRAEKEFITFPNIIDKSVYTRDVEAIRRNRDELRRSLGVDDATQLWVCPARLEAVKGLDAFLPLLRGVKGVRLVIAGEGSQRKLLEQMIVELGLPVVLLGQRSESELVRLYAAADLFVLPSRSDPSPLAPIEASAAALPLLISNRAGNVDEVLVDGRNGWRFDADAPASNAALIQRIAAMPRADLAERGRASRALYDERFDSDECVQRLVDGVLGIHLSRT